MEQITIRLPEAMLESLESEAEEKDVSRSEHIRDVIASREEVSELRSEVERLRNQQEVLVQQRAETTDLVEYIEDEQTWREASLPTRAKWWLFGKSG